MSSAASQRPPSPRGPRTLAAPRGIESLDACTDRLNSDARTAWVDWALSCRWTFFLRPSWAWPVSEFTAYRHVEKWAGRLQRDVSGAAVLVGLHSDVNRLHPHALLYVPGVEAPPEGRSLSHTASAQRWQQSYWKHGLLWLDWFRPFRIKGRGYPDRHKAAAYVAKEVGTVQLYGDPIPYAPRRTRGAT